MYRRAARGLNVLSKAENFSEILVTNKSLKYEQTDNFYLPPVKLIAWPDSGRFLYCDDIAKS